MTTDSLRCCLCGADTEEAVDYIRMDLTAPYSSGFQTFGVHAACLNGVLAPGFSAEVHLFGRSDDAGQ